MITAIPATGRGIVSNASQKRPRRPTGRPWTLNGLITAALAGGPPPANWEVFFDWGLTPFGSRRYHYALVTQEAAIAQSAGCTLGTNRHPGRFFNSSVRATLASIT